MTTKYLYKILFILGITAWTGCSEEDNKLGHTPVSDKDVLIEVSLDELLSNNMNSRAVTEEDNAKFAQVNNINIRIEFNNGTIYCYTQKGDEHLNIEEGSGVIIQKLDDKGHAYIHIDSKNAKQAMKAEVIANWGTALNDDTAWETAKGKIINWPNSFNDNEACLLYGIETTAREAELEHDAQGNNVKCKWYKVCLKRPYAMIKVNIDTKGLYYRDPTNGTVSIIPQSVQLCNVPKTCSLANDNSSNSINDFNAKGQYYEFTDGIELEGNNEATTYLSAGRLYMFENKQNKNVDACQTSGDGERGKTPNARGTAFDAFTDYTDANRHGRRCSYILLTAKYKHISEHAHVEGTIRYRLFLGENINYNFDINRNTIYTVTLFLSKMGGIDEAGYTASNGVINVSGSKPSAQWRVDAELSDFFIHFDEGQDFNIDGHLMKIKIVVPEGNKETWEIKVGDNKNELYNSWLKFQNDKGEYVSPWYKSEASDVDAIQATGIRTINVFLKSYAEQWNSLSDSWNISEPYRSINLYIRKLNQSATEQKYTIKQWYPIKINNDLYVDRIDRFAKNGLPWGKDNYNKTEGKEILIDYFKNANNGKYNIENSENSTMDNTITVSFNSSGSSQPVTKVDLSMQDNAQFNYYSLPTIEEWEEINKTIQRTDINYNKWASVPYWTSTTDGSQSKTYTPGASPTVESKQRKELHRFRLVWKKDIFWP